MTSFGIEYCFIFHHTILIFRKNSVLLQHFATRLKSYDNTYQDLFVRYASNPVLSAKDWPYPAVTSFQNKTLLLARVEDRRDFPILQKPSVKAASSIGWLTSSRRSRRIRITIPKKHGCWGSTDYAAWGIGQMGNHIYRIFKIRAYGFPRTDKRLYRIRENWFSFASGG